MNIGKLNFRSICTSERARMKQVTHSSEEMDEKKTTSSVKHGIRLGNDVSFVSHQDRP